MPRTKKTEPCILNGGGPDDGAISRVELTLDEIVITTRRGGMPLSEYFYERTPAYSDGRRVFKLAHSQRSKWQPRRRGGAAGQSETHKAP